MSALDQIREGAAHAWDNLAEGWRDLRERASHALTRFTPRQPPGELNAGAEDVMRHASRWGLLAAEVKMDDNDVHVKLEIPGMDAGGFDIEVVNHMLVVRGEKRVESEQTRGQYYVMERAYGRFERAIPLPAEVDQFRAKARYRRGVLRVTLPRTQAVRGRRIRID
ncbi:MAG: Hsp20/alpha crystallin family protein [Acidiferrobacterales bacterium]